MRERSALPVQVGVDEADVRMLARVMDTVDENQIPQQPKGCKVCPRKCNVYFPLILMFNPKYLLQKSVS